MKNVIIKIIAFMLTVMSIFMFSCSGCGEKNPNNDSDNNQTNFRSDVDKYAYTYPTIIVGATEINLSVGKTFKIKYALKNISETVKFSSKDQTVATVDNQGVVEARDVGETIITLFAGGTLKNIVVNVSASPTYNVICDEGVELSLCINEAFKINPMLLMGNEEIAGEFTFESLNEDLLRVSGNGEITPLNTGVGYIKASTVKDGKTYSIKIKVSAHELCYIDIPDVIKAGYKESITIDYPIKEYVSNNIINGARLQVIDNEFVDVVGNIVTPTDIGKLPLKVDYYGVEKLIHLDVEYVAEENEFNFFTHEYTIRKSSAYRKNKFKDASNMANLSIVNNVGEEQGRFLKVDVKNSSGNGMGYMNVYLQCVQTKTRLQDLYENGYKTIKFEYYIDAGVEHENSQPQNTFIFRWKDGEITGSVNYAQECVYNKENSFKKWITVDLPLAKYIEYYDVLNNIDSLNSSYSGFFETSFEKNKLDVNGNIIYNQNGTTPIKLEENNPYVIYIKPIKLSK